MKKLLTLAAFWIAIMTVSAQSTGEIKGKILDEKGEGLIGGIAQIVDVNGKTTGQGGAADYDGNYTIPLTAGTYNVKVSGIGYETQIITGVTVSADKPTFLNFNMKVQPVSAVKGGGDVVVEVKKYVKPLIEKGDTKIESSVDAKDIRNSGGLSVQNVVGNQVGVTQTDAGSKSLVINGGRPDEVQYIINGHRVIGNVNLPTNGIREISVLTGGISSKYGDATSGIINITLNDAQQGLTGSVEGKTTKGLDAFGTTRAAGNISMPLLKLKDKTSTTGDKRTVLGLSLSFQYQHDDDRSPSAIGIWQVKQSALNNIRTGPLVVNPTGGFYNKAEFLTFQDMYKTSMKPNNNENEYTGGGELGIYPTKNISIAVGGNYDYDKYHSYVQEYSLLNAEHNPLYTNTNYYIYGRLTQRFGPKPTKPGEGQAPVKKSGLAIENGSYTIQFDYEKYKTGYADQAHGSNLFDYGYIGKFQTEGAYEFGVANKTVTNKGVTYNLNGFVQNLSQTDTLVRFTPGTVNPLGATFTRQYYELLGATQNPDGSYVVPTASRAGYADNVNNIQANNGLINGTRSNPIYDLWYNVGRQYNGYGIDKNNQSYRGKVEGSFDIVKLGSEDKANNTHKIEMGIEYEQRIQRSYLINPLNLWDAAKSLVNTHISLDTSNPIFRINGVDYDSAHVNLTNFTSTDTIKYNSIANLSQQETFDRNLRTALGYDPNGTNLIDIYAVDPHILNLGLFKPDDLLKYTGGGSSSILSYYGYDYKGNVLTTQPTLNDFFKAKDANGNYIRNMGAFMPTYTAGYIQDKFFYKDLGFVVGLRVDRYDANQYVLKDPYSLYATKKAGDADIKAQFNVPSNIPSDAVVYIDHNGAGARVTGYRQGDNWYDQYGRVTTGKFVSLQSSNGLLPYLNVPGVDNMTPAVAKAYIKSSDYDPNGSFTKYQAQYIFMPRIQLAFNITDKAQFFAHYDILSQRPQDRNQLNLAEYLYFTEYSAVKNNPNLKPIRKTDYEFGFKQAIASFAAVTVSAFYQETRNLIQLRKMQYAFPSDYTTYDNIDFRSAKGFRLLIDFRRFHNFQFNANYTLQFVEGTGSDDQSQLYLISNNQPNFRSVYPISTDARHQFKFTLDYRFGEGAAYTGPRINGYKVLENFGVNLVMNLRSGTPVRQTATVTDEASITGSGGRQRTISLSSRLPWYTRLDLRVNKDFVFAVGKKSENKDQRNIGLSIYVYIQNLLNTENILAVYPYTLNANDDGFLTANGSAVVIASKTNPQSYKDLYRAKVNNPDNYSLPRRIYLGANINF
ncbi:MAG: carboxypeptidase regulatory-like domain-containing protein [Bacteroidetes bacterium]|nr:carboxypeptidase regulatory-like domain-containing protein [Bacteroidota bacterium]